MVVESIFLEVINEITIKWKSNPVVSTKWKSDFFIAIEGLTLRING